MVKIWWGLKFVDIFHMFFKIQIRLAKGWYTIANFSHNWAIYKNGPPGRFFIKSTVAQMGHNVFYLLIFIIFSFFSFFRNFVSSYHSCIYNVIIPEQFTAIGPPSFIWRGEGGRGKNCGGTLSRGFGQRLRPEEFSSRDSAGDFGLRSFLRPEIYCEGPLYEYEYEFEYEYRFTDS